MPRPGTRRSSSRPKTVKEPIQVYLDRDDRALLDRVARETGLSRAEILRRGVRAFAAERQGADTPMLRFMRDMEQLDWPPDIASRTADQLAEAYMDRHEDAWPKRS